MQSFEAAKKSQGDVGSYLEAGGTELFCMVVQDIEEGLVLDASHLQYLSSTIADVAGIQ